MKGLAIGFLALLLWTAATSAGEIMTNDGRVIVVPEAPTPRRAKRPTPSSVRRQVSNPIRNHRRMPRAEAAEPAHAGSLIGQMRADIGGNPTGWARAWCAHYLNVILRRLGLRGTGSAAAISFARYGHPTDRPAPGVIVVWRHHVGVVTATAPGRIRVISGNDGHRVRERWRSLRGVVALRQ